MPTPHRRSCQQCVKAKRRCDLGTPCYRCRVRRVPCTYDAVAGDALRQSRAEALQTSEETIPQDVLPAFPDQNLDWNEIMDDIDDFVIPDQLAVIQPQPAGTVLTGSIYQERVVHAVKQLKKWPLDFARNASAPFINLKAYKDEIPDILRDALGMCSLYAHRTDHNEKVVFQCLSQAASKCMARLAGVTESTLLTERLAITQALCLYKTMQLYDGDITMRANAETALPLFVTYLRSLRDSLFSSLYDQKALMLQSAGLSESPDDWHNWLLLESVRRTLVAGFCIEELFLFLKQGWDDGVDFQRISFFAQQSLWKAQTFYQWRQAYRTKLPLPVRFDDWSHDIAAASPDDMDELGMTMMTLVKGVDYCRSWVGDENLEKFDLVPH